MATRPSGGTAGVLAIVSRLADQPVTVAMIRNDAWPLPFSGEIDLERDHRGALAVAGAGAGLRRAVEGKASDARVCGVSRNAKDIAGHHTEGAEIDVDVIRDTHGVGILHVRQNEIAHADLRPAAGIVGSVDEVLTPGSARSNLTNLILGNHGREGQGRADLDAFRQQSRCGCPVRVVEGVDRGCHLVRDIGDVSMRREGCCDHADQEA
jgi:hypothetical protein